MPSPRLQKLEDEVKEIEKDLHKLALHVQALTEITNNLIRTLNVSAPVIEDTQSKLIQSEDTGSTLGDSRIGDPKLLSGSSSGDAPRNPKSNGESSTGEAANVDEPHSDVNP